MKLQRSLRVRCSRSATPVQPFLTRVPVLFWGGMVGDQRLNYINILNSSFNQIYIYISWYVCDNTLADTYIQVYPSRSIANMQTQPHHITYHILSLMYWTSIQTPNSPTCRSSEWSHGHSLLCPWFWKNWHQSLESLHACQPQKCLKTQHVGTQIDQFWGDFLVV